MSDSLVDVQTFTVDPAAFEDHYTVTADELLTGASAGSKAFWVCPTCARIYGSRDQTGPIHCEGVNYHPRHFGRMRRVAALTFHCEWGHDFDVWFMEGAGTFYVHVRQRFVDLPDGAREECAR